MEPFWAVVNLDQHPMQFTFRHPSEESAIRESGRLARMHRGRKFAVMSLVGWSGQPDIPVSWNLPEPAPLPYEDIAELDAQHAAHPVGRPESTPQDDWPEVVGLDPDTYEFGQHPEI